MRSNEIVRIFILDTSPGRGYNMLIKSEEADQKASSLFLFR